MSEPLQYLDPMGEGMPYVLDRSTGKSVSVYNGSNPCEACGSILNPVQALNSTLCSGCSRRKAARQVANRMA